MSTSAPWSTSRLMDQQSSPAEVAVQSGRCVLAKSIVVDGVRVQRYRRSTLVMPVVSLIAKIAFHLRPGLGKTKPIAAAERLPLTRCRCTLDALASSATTTTTPSSISPMAATVSSSTTAAATLSAGKQSMTAPHWLCSFDLVKPVPKDFSSSLRGWSQTLSRGRHSVRCSFVRWRAICRRDMTSVLWISRPARMFTASPTRPIHANGSSPLCVPRFSNLAIHRSCWAAPLGSNQPSTTFWPPLDDPAWTIVLVRGAKTTPSPRISQARVASSIRRPSVFFAARWV